MNDLNECCWQPGELANSLHWLMAMDGGASVAIQDRQLDCNATPLEETIGHAASVLGVRMTGITCAPDTVTESVIDSVPLIARSRDGMTALYVARATRRYATVIAPSGKAVRLRLRAVVDWMMVQQFNGAASTADVLAREFGRGGARIARALVAQQSVNAPLQLGWMLESSSVAKPRRDLSIRDCVPLLTTHALQYSLWVMSWLALVMLLAGPGASAGIMSIWIATLVSALALLPVETALEHRLAARIGIAVKRRLLVDALNADKGHVGALGLGQMIARSLETHHIDAMAARGSIRVVLATFDALLAVSVYGAFFGVDGLIVLFCLVVAWGVVRGASYYAHAIDYLGRNLDATGVHTEQLVGHRTRKAFVHMEQWNADEDRSVARYHESARRFDDSFLGLSVLPRVWMVIAMLVVLVTLYRTFGVEAGVANVAMVGLVIATFAALQSIVLGTTEAVRAWVSFKALDTLVRDRLTNKPQAARLQHATRGGVRCRGVNFKYPRSIRPVLEDANLYIAEADRVLLTGRSGSGKSTLATIMAGRLQQDSGIVLSGGIDRHVAGMAQWRNLVCYVPQQGANHVLTETFAFNLLLGRPWPPSRSDLDEALAVAKDLGLDSLLDRMPAGMMQMIGEGGWTLSQGEKARLFVARGILQRARLLIVDEILSPLDARTATKTLDVLERHSGAVILIAHI